MSRTIELLPGESLTLRRGIAIAAALRPFWVVLPRRFSESPAAVLGTPVRKPMQ